LKDLKRFQKEKEDDLQRYMVSFSPDVLSTPLQIADQCRLLTPDAILTGQGRILRPGQRLEKRSTRS
jgi:hypothetical protein